MVETAQHISMALGLLAVTGITITLVCIAAGLIKV